MPFKPMLATAIEDVSTLKFPLMASQKLDGIRATVQGGVLLSRSLKPIPNKYIQEMFADLPEGLDGELILDDPFAEDCYRKTVSVVMSDGKAAVGVTFHLFDRFENVGFKSRFDLLSATVDHPFTKIVHHVTVPTLAALELFEMKLLERGAEGVMLRSLDGPYKNGRSSLKEGYLLKLKRFKDCEARIVRLDERQHNENVAFTNELGRTARSSHQENKTGMGTLGALEVIGINGDYSGVTFRVGTGFDDEMRQLMWDDPKTMGRVVKVKYFPIGCKDTPRHPVFVGFRDKRDM